MPDSFDPSTFLSESPPVSKASKTVLEINPRAKPKPLDILTMESHLVSLGVVPPLAKHITSRVDLTKTKLHNSARRILDEGFIWAESPEKSIFWINVCANLPN